VLQSESFLVPESEIQKILKEMGVEGQPNLNYNSFLETMRRGLKN